MDVLPLPLRGGGLMLGVRRGPRRESAAVDHVSRQLVADAVDERILTSLALSSFANATGRSASGNPPGKVNARGRAGGFRSFEISEGPENLGVRTRHHGAQVDHRFDRSLANLRARFAVQLTWLTRAGTLHPLGSMFASRSTCSDSQ